MDRPSHKELSKKINVASLAVEQGKVAYIDPVVLAIDAMELGYEFEDEILEIMSDLLAVVKPVDYVGTRPPQKSYEKVVKGMDLFAFAVQGTILEDFIYFKFSLKNEICYIASLHKDR